LKCNPGSCTTWCARINNHQFCHRVSSTI
jgi:hypothetical protein